MNELEFNWLIKMLKDDFDGDYPITRTRLLELLEKAKWNTRVQVKDELEAENKQFLQEVEQRPHESWCAYLNQTLMTRPPMPAPCNCQETA